MRELDGALDEALRAEERDLLRRIGDEPGFFRQAASVFDGRAGWVSAILMGVQTAAFLAGAWAAWNFFQAAETLSALRWGLPAAVLLLTGLTIKLALWPVMHTNRLLQELKRVELLIVAGRRD